MKKILKLCLEKYILESYHLFKGDISINPFVPNAPFLYPLKTWENLRVFWCFQDVEKECIGNNILIIILRAKLIFIVNLPAPCISESWIWIFIFVFLCGTSKGFMKVLQGLHKTFWGTTKKWEDWKSKLIFSLCLGSVREGLISEAKFGDTPNRFPAMFDIELARF